MLTSLAILIHLLAADSGEQQTPHLSPGLTEVKTCCDPRMFTLTLPILMHTDLSPEFVTEGEMSDMHSVPFL